MRRRREHESSLDLLLDTICNMFGMVIFIAVLAAVLASASGARRINDAAAAISGADMVELRSLQAAIDDLEANDDEVYRDRWQAALEELERTQAYGAQLMASIEAIERQLAGQNAGESLEQLRVDVRTLKEELQALHDLRDITLRTPRRRSLKGRVPVQVVLTEDRFYLLNDWSDWRSTRDPVGQRCQFWRTWNPQAVDPGSSTFHDYGTCGFRTGGIKIDREVQLRGDGGIPLGSQSGLVDIASLMDDLVPGQHVVSFRVTPDSFDRFHDARRLVLGAGIEYDVRPIPSLGPSMLFRDKIRVGTATGQ